MPARTNFPRLIGISLGLLVGGLAAATLAGFLFLSSIVVWAVVSDPYSEGTLGISTPLKVGLLAAGNALSLLGMAGSLMWGRRRWGVAILLTVVWVAGLAAVTTKMASIGAAEEAQLSNSVTEN